MSQGVHPQPQLPSSGTPKSARPGSSLPREPSSVVHSGQMRTLFYHKFLSSPSPLQKGVPREPHLVKRGSRPGLNAALAWSAGALMSTWPHAWVPTPTQKGCSCVRPFCTLVRKSMLACVRAPAAVAVAQWMARQLPWPGISWLEGAMDDDAARCAVGRKASPAAQSVCLELPQRGPGSFAVCHHRAPTVPAGSNSPQLMGTAAVCSLGCI